MASTLQFRSRVPDKVVQSMYIRVAGLATSACYGAAIVWLYLHQPQSVAEVTGSFAATVGAYQIELVAANPFGRNDCDFRVTRRP